MKNIITFKSSKLKKITFVVVAIFLATITTIGVVLNILMPKNASLISKESKNNKIINHTQKSQDTIKFTYYNKTPVIITEKGPIVYNNNVIYLLDWFGNPIWTTDVGPILVEKGISKPGGLKVGLSGFPKGNYWNNWVYDAINQKIYLSIPATSPGSKYFLHESDDWKYMYILPMNAQTGEIEIGSKKPNQLVRIDVKNRTGWGNNDWMDLQFAQMAWTTDNNIMLYNIQGSTGFENAGHSFVIYNPRTNELSDKTNILGMVGNFSYKVNGLFMWVIKPTNIIPVTTNQNLIIAQQFAGLDGPYTYANYKDSGTIYSFFVDNNLQSINPNTRWFEAINYQTSNHYHLTNTFKKLGGVIGVQYDFGYNVNYYVHPISKVVQFSIYDKMYFVSPDNSSLGYEYTSFDLPKVGQGNYYYQTGTYYSGYFDLKGDLYFNMAIWNTQSNKWSTMPTIYKMSYNGEKAIVTPFVDLSTSTNPDILNNINQFKIFSIPTQVGKIMLLNEETGIGVAVIENPDMPGVGRILGTLNGAHSFLANPDFTLNSGAYFVRPSQLKSQDLIANGNGTISGFKVISANDHNGSITIEATINYLPWFEQPNSFNIQSTVVRKTFTNLATTSNMKWTQFLNFQLKAVTTDFIDETTLKRFHLFNLTSNNLTTNANLKYKINKIDAKSGQFTTSVDVDYATNLDPNGLRLNYQSNMQYQVLPKSEDKSDYQLELVGGSKIINNQLSHISTVHVANLPFNNRIFLQELTPSQVKSGGEESIFNLVNISDLKGYPLFLLDKQLIADDNKGTLKVIITIPKTINQKLGFDAMEKRLETTYAGLKTEKSNHKKVINFSKFKQVVEKNYKYFSSINDLQDRFVAQKLLNCLPTELNVSDVWNYFLTTKNINVNLMFDTNLIYDNFNGSLKIILKKKPQFNALLKDLQLFPNEHQLVEIEIIGFQKIIPQVYEDNLLHFAPNNNEKLLNLQKRRPDTVVFEEIKSLISIGKHLQQLLPLDFVLEKNNVELIGKNEIGQLIIIVNLNEALKEQKNYIVNNGISIKLPTYYQHVYDGFATFQNHDYIFQTLKQNQLSQNLNLKNLTPEIVFANQDKFILINQGYALISSEQISVIHNSFLNAVFVTFDFTTTSNLSNEINRIFSTVYEYLQ